MCLLVLLTGSSLFLLSEFSGVVGLLLVTRSVWDVLLVAETWRPGTVWLVNIIWWKLPTLVLLGWWKTKHTQLTLVLSFPSSGPLLKAWLSTDSLPNLMSGVCMNNNYYLCKWSKFQNISYYHCLSTAVQKLSHNVAVKQSATIDSSTVHFSTVRVPSSVIQKSSPEYV